MSDIQAGDVVVCVNLRPDAWGHVPRLAAGSIHRVEAVVTGRDRFGEDIYLVLVGRPREPKKFGYRAWRFRKLNDGTDDAELIARIRKCKPARQPEPAL